MQRITPIFRLLTALLFLVAVAACGSTTTPMPAPLPTSTPITLDSVSSPDEPLAGVRTYVVVPGESQASYLVDEEFFDGALAKLGIRSGKVDVVGTSQEINGQLQLNLDDLTKPLGENFFTVDLTRLTTDQNQRDSWIQDNGPEFARFPLAEFRATAIAGAPTTYTPRTEVTFQLTGDLTIRQITKPVTFDVVARLEGDTITGTATTRLLMSEFGIEPPSFINTLNVQDEFGIQVDLVARSQ